MIREGPKQSTSWSVRVSASRDAKAHHPVEMAGFLLVAGGRNRLNRTELRWNPRLKSQR